MVKNSGSSSKNIDFLFGLRKNEGEKKKKMKKKATLHWFGRNFRRKESSNKVKENNL